MPIESAQYWGHVWRRRRGSRTSTRREPRAAYMMSLDECTHILPPAHARLARPRSRRRKPPLCCERANDHKRRTHRGEAPHCNKSHARALAGAHAPSAFLNSREGRTRHVGEADACPAQSSTRRPRGDGTDIDGKGSTAVLDDDLTGNRRPPPRTRRRNLSIGGTSGTRDGDARGRSRWRARSVGRSAT